jgi:hypothetical protein
MPIISEPLHEEELEVEGWKLQVASCGLEVFFRGAGRGEAPVASRAAARIGSGSGWAGVWAKAHHIVGQPPPLRTIRMMQEPRPIGTGVF